MYAQNLKKLIEMHVFNIESLKFKKLFYKSLILNLKIVLIKMLQRFTIFENY